MDAITDKTEKPTSLVSNEALPTINMDDWPELDDVMSNFDHMIERAVEEQLKRGNCWAGYPGWNFYGRVFWDPEKQLWGCQVWQYRVVRETIYEPSLKELHSSVCDKYGYE